MSTYPWARQGKKLTDYDIPRIGHLIGVGEDEVHAVLDVESKGTGFDQYGVIRLFESHVFYRRLPADKKAKALSMGIAHTSWEKAKAAGNYKYNYQKFLKAYEYDQTAALESCSWGLAQIMGFNHKQAGYPSALDMVKAFAESEANQLEAMIKFIKVSRLDDELRAHDWEGFARGYNGSGFRKNNYHNRLRKAYEWWSKKPDAKWSPASAAGEEMEAVTSLQEQAKPVSVLPHTAATVATVSVIPASGLPLWAQYVLGVAVIVFGSYIIYRRLTED